LKQISHNYYYFDSDATFSPIGSRKHRDVVGCQSGTDRPSLRELSDMIDKSCEIPVSLELVPQLVDKINAVKQWINTAEKAFVSDRNPCSLLEVFAASYLAVVLVVNTLHCY